MAVKTFFGTNTVLNAEAPKFQELSEVSPGANATSSPNVGWTVGTNAPTVYKLMGAGEERSASSWSGTAKPAAASLATESNSAFRTKEKYKGKFAAGAWALHNLVRAVTAGADQDGAVTVRVYRSKNGNGSSATEITSGLLTGSTVTNLATGADQDSLVTWEPGAIELNEEYLFFDIAWKITGAGGGATRDVIFRWGETATRIVTPNFSSALVGEVKQATETDAALPLKATKARELGRAESVEVALPIRPAKRRTIGVATEVDAAMAIAKRKAVALGLATESDSAQMIEARVVGQPQITLPTSATIAPFAVEAATEPIEVSADVAPFAVSAEVSAFDTTVQVATLQAEADLNAFDTSAEIQPLELAAEISS